MSKRYDVITFHPHAAWRMKRRKVSENQVRRALNDEAAYIYPNEGKSVAEVTTKTGATLRVVFVEPKPHSAFVITVIRIG